MKIFVLSIFFCGSVFAQENSLPGDGAGYVIGDPIIAFVYVAISRLMPTPKRPIPKDQIWGKCSYKNYSCNGAEILLMDQNDNIKDTRRIAGDSNFLFSGIDKSVEYKIKVKYQKIISTQFTVSGGEEVSVTLTDNEI